MSGSKLFLRTLTLPLTLLSSAVLSSAVLASSVDQSESILLDPLTRSYVSSTDSLDGDFAEKGIAKEESRTVGAEVVSSEDVNVYAIPLSYGIPISLMGGEEYLNVSADLPYVMSDTAAGEESGIGDIRFGAEYFFERKNMILKVSADIKLPTGDGDKFLGTDSTDVGFSFTGRKREGMLGFNATGAYVFRGEGDVAGTTRDYGNMLSLSGGAEYKLGQRLWGGVNGAFVRSGTTDIDGFEADGLQTIDVIPNISFRFNTDMTIVGTLVIPLHESVVDGDAKGDEPDRETSINFSFTSDF